MFEPKAEEASPEAMLEYPKAEERHPEAERQ
jgi:hypothetical protein